VLERFKNPNLTEAKIAFKDVIIANTTAILDLSLKAILEWSALTDALCKIIEAVQSKNGIKSKISDTANVNCSTLNRPPYLVANISITPATPDAPKKVAIHFHVLIDPSNVFRYSRSL